MGGSMPREMRLRMVSAVSIWTMSTPVSDEVEQALSPPGSSNNVSPHGPQLSITISANSYSFFPDGWRDSVCRVCSSDVTATSACPHSFERPAGTQREVFQVYPVDRHKPTCTSCQFHSECARVTRSIYLNNSILPDAIGKEESGTADSIGLG